MVHLQCVEASLNQFELAVKSLGILFEECFVETIAGDGQLPTASCTCSKAQHLCSPCISGMRLA
jgi:hypothetical protein